MAKKDFNFDAFALDVAPEIIGLEYNDKGKIVVNVNIYVPFYLKSHSTVILDGSRYFRYSKASKVWGEIKPLDIKRQMKRLLDSFVPNLWSLNIERACMGMLPLVCGKAEKLQSPANYINLKNGLFNLETHTLEKHDMGVFTTSQLPIHYDPKAKCLIFKKFLRQIFMEDKEIIRLIQEILGYILSPKIDAQKFFIFFSPGASGKSTLCDILYELAGGAENVSSIALGDLNKKFARSQIVGKVLNLSTESDVSGGLDTQALKAMTSGDPMQMERKMESPFTCRVNAKLVFAVNNPPYPKDRSYAFARRMILIPFPVRFVDNPVGKYEAQIDRDIKSQLLPELQGIFSFALRGLRRLMDNKFRFSQSEQVDKFIAGYMRDVNPILDFVKSSIREKDDGKISTERLYSNFKQWCGDNGYSRSSLLSKRRFLREFRNQLLTENITYTEGKSNGSRLFKGIDFAENTRTAIQRRENAERTVRVTSLNELD